jgi:2'-5' RNA ligase
MRLFVAIDLPDHVAGQVRALCHGLSAAQWSNPAQLHLTLRFLGELPEDRAEALKVQLQRVSHPPFQLGLHGVGVFPRNRRPARVLWAGVTPLEPIVALKAAIDEVVGADPETSERGFSPHLTLARFRNDPGPELDHYLRERAGFGGATWTADAFLLYRSTLGSDGARHEIFGRYPVQAP